VVVEKTAAGIEHHNDFVTDAERQPGRAEIEGVLGTGDVVHGEAAVINDIAAYNRTQVEVDAVALVAVADQLRGEENGLGDKSRIGVENSGGKSGGCGVRENAGGFVDPRRPAWPKSDASRQTELCISSKISVAGARIGTHQRAVLVTIVKGPFFVACLRGVGATQRRHVIINANEIGTEGGGYEKKAEEYTGWNFHDHTGG
jgi:hypothetical protein